MDNTPRSLLAFEGAAAVAGLGDWLFNEAPVGDGAGAGAAGCDVPTLLAPVPFEHAALRRLTPQVRPFLVTVLSWQPIRPFNKLYRCVVVVRCITVHNLHVKIIHKPANQATSVSQMHMR